MRLIDEIAYQYKIAKIPMEERTFVRAWETAQNMPTIDAAPVVRGKWIYHYDDLFPMESTQECSVCHEEEYITLCNDNYCPNCGAKMEDKPCG